MEPEATLTVATALLQVLAFSALATDRLQSHEVYFCSEELSCGYWSPTESHWIGENNPLLAGQPNNIDPYFDWWASVVIGLARSKHPWSKPGLVALAAFQLSIAHTNNSHMRLARFPTFAVAEYRLAF